MKALDIYDFDKTLVPFDSGTKFAFYCCRRYPWVLPWLPVVGVAALLGLLGVLRWEQFKKICFSFMPFIPRERAIRGFWDQYARFVFDWFKERPREAVIISASPDFLLEEIQRRVGFEGLLCTPHNPKTGAICGKNCRGEEKVRRFYEAYPRGEWRVVDVYSDSLKNDMPIFRLAEENCYQIIDGRRHRFSVHDIEN